MIKFQCPNGHPLSTTDDRAGTAAKCPKCQMPLVVPMTSTSSAPAAPSGSGKLASEAHDAPTDVSNSSTKAAASQSNPQNAPPAATPDLIVFLCPNGHKLNGPARLKGKAGQCPHCGAKFRIPEDDEEDIEDFEEFEEEHDQIAESMTEEEFAAEEVEEVDIEEITEFEEDADEEFAAEEIEDEDEGELEPFEEAPPTVIDAFLTPVADGIHPYASIVTFIWAAKEPGQVVDLYLQKGEIFTPELFAEGLSQPNFGVFGRREKEGGGHTLIMLPWDTIVRIEVRNVRQVPVGLLK